MMPVAYLVTATFPNDAFRDEFLRWLLDEHLAEVLGAGATSAHAVKLDEPPPRVIASYTFSDRTTYDRYIREAAPALRAKGLARFPPSTGVIFSRQSGTILVPSPNVSHSPPHA
jgi:hypothetical protein